MAQIINDPYRNRDFSAIQKHERETPYFNAVSSLVGGLIHSKTQELAQRKQQQKTASGLQHLLNIPAQEAYHLAGLDPKLLEHVVKDRMSQQRVNALQSLFNFTPEQAAEVEPLLEEESGLSQLSSGQQQELAAEESAQPRARASQLNPSFRFPANAPQFEAPSFNPMARTEAAEAIENAPEQIIEPQATPAQVQQLQKAEREIIKEQKRVPKEKLTATEQKSAEKEQKKLAHEQKKILEKQQAEQRKMTEKEQAAAQKETQKYYDQVLAVDKSARESDARLDRMLKLIDEGNLPFSSLYSGLKNVEEHVSPVTGASAGGAIGGIIGGLLAGGPTAGIAAAPGAAVGTAIGGAIGGLVNPVVGLLRSIQRFTSPDTEEFEKLSSQFISGAKSIFGSRITDQDLRAYMAQIPTLSNTDAGKRKIIRSMKIANDAEHVRAKAMKEIIKENGGKRPATLPILVEERAQAELDRLAEKFVNESKPKKAKKEVERPSSPAVNLLRNLI